MDAVMEMDFDQPLLTLKTLRDWQSRQAQLVESIRAQQEEVAALTRKIDAAKNLLETLSVDEGEEARDAKESPSLTFAPDTSPADESISHAVLAAVGAMKAAPKAAAIKKWIMMHNPAVGTKLDASPAYLYTALMRHVRAGRLVKRSKVYRLPNRSPKGETRGMAPPVPVNP